MFAAAHRLRQYKGKCENLHGHNWKVAVAVEGETLDKTGILVDFTILKKELNEILKVLDHKNLNGIEFFKKKNPTSENISFYIYQKIKVALKEYPVRVKYVKVWESDKQFAQYSQDTTGEKE